jgi:hypothetical protein
MREWRTAAAFPLLVASVILWAGAVATGQANTIGSLLRDDPAHVAQIRDLPYLILALVPVPGLLFPLRTSKSAGSVARIAALVALVSLLLAAASSFVFAYTPHDTGQQLLDALGAFLVTWLVGWAALILALIARRRPGRIGAHAAQGTSDGSALPPGI